MTATAMADVPEDPEDLDDLNGIIDRLLAERRPDRYKQTEADWLDDIADEVAGLIPESQARFVAAIQKVKARERTKTGQANKLLRKIHESGEFPLGWLDLVNLPLAVDKERVALRALSADDLRVFANVERRDAMRDAAARNLTCEAAEWLAERMDQQSASRLGDAFL